MKKIILLVLIPFLFGCEIQYDGNTKLIVKGSVIDANNNPIANKDVNLYVLKESFSIPFIFYIPSENNYIGKSTTDRNGNYTMVIPKPENFSEIIVETNDENNQLSGKQFKNINFSNFTNYQIELPNTKLYLKSTLANLNVILNNVNSNTELVKLEYVGNIPNEIEFINPLENSNSNLITNLNVEKNQTVVLKFTVFNNLNQTNSTIEQNIVIDNSDEVSYNLNY